MQTNNHPINELRTLLTSIDELNAVSFSDDELETDLIMAAEDIEIFAKDLEVPNYLLTTGMFKDATTFIAGFYATTRYAIKEMAKEKGSEDYLDNLVELEMALQSIIETTLFSHVEDAGIDIENKDEQDYDLHDAIFMYSEPAEYTDTVYEEKVDYVTYGRDPG